MLETIGELHLRLSGLASLLDATDEYMTKVRVYDPNFNDAANLVLVAIREVEGAKAVLDGLETKLRDLDYDE